MAFGYYRAIVVDHLKVGGADLTSFPVGIIGTYASLATVANGGHVQSANGYDIRPYADSALTTPLDFELVAYSPTTGAVELWVRIPSLSHTVDTTIYLAYGDASLTTNGSSAAAWASSFAAVWHLGDGATLSLADSTSNARTLTNSTAPNQTTATTGKISGGANFVGGAQSLMRAFSGTGNAPVTIELLVKTASTGAQVGIFSWHVTDASLPFVLIAYESGNLKFYGDNGYRYTQAIATGTWYALAVTYDGAGTYTFYVNGVAASYTGANPPQNIANAINLWFGTGYNGGLNGVLDELRLSTVARPAGWITAEYNNQSSPATFYAVGTETAVSGGSPVSGSGTVTLPHITASGTAAAAARASGSAALPHVTASGSGVSPHQATGAATLPHLGAAGTAQALAKGTGTTQLPHLAASGTATVGTITSAAGAVTLPHLTASGTATSPHRASGAAVLPHLVAAGSGLSLSRATGSATLPRLTAAGSAQSLARAGGVVVLPSFVASGVTATLASASGVAGLPMLVAGGEAHGPFGAFVLATSPTAVTLAGSRTTATITTTRTLATLAASRTSVAAEPSRTTATFH